MAEALARYDAADVIEPSSAGLHPLGYIADLTKQTLMNNGYSAEGLTSDRLTAAVSDAAEIIINMTGRPREVNFSASDYERIEDWIVEDPYDDDAETYQRVFESLKRRVNQLASGLREKRQNRAAVE
jgi:protein-tyrosine-phosphatase